MKELRIGGVPEHFNLPWHLLLDSGDLVSEGINASWRDFPGGTGAMVEALNNDEIDLAMLLTEGAIAGIDKGGAYRIVSLYVASPLVWGIHVPSQSDFYTMDDVKGKRYAISRYGSGSHLMAYIDARTRDWEVGDMKFELVKNLEGARKAFKQGGAEIFLWEKFTTKPYVDNGEFRRIDECPTPFPCFVVCASKKVLSTSIDMVQAVLEKVIWQAKNLMQNENRVQLIADRYGLQERDVAEWLDMTRWTADTKIDQSMIGDVVEILVQLGLVDTKLKIEKLIHPL